MSWIPSYLTILHFKILDNYYVAENNSCSSICCQKRTSVLSNTNTQGKKGAITVFPWIKKIQLWRPKSRYLNTPRLWAEPKSIHSLLCAKYRTQLPLTQPRARVDKLPEASHTFTELKGPNDTPEQTFFFQGQLDDNALDFYRHTQNILEWLTSGGFPPLVFH